jgi:type III pantothenate kinase
MNKRRLLAVDIGNSATKVGWFDSSSERQTAKLPQPVATKKFKTTEVPNEEFARSLPGDPCEWQIVSVHREGTRILTNWMAANRPQDACCVLGHQNLPIETRVDHPDRVGLDRLAAAVAANLIRDAGRPAIVVGAGSAITVNLVASDGAFEGGVILPGFRMSAEALYGADLLPLALLEPNNEPPPLVGKNTEDAIRSGLFWGAVGAVREVVTRMSQSLSIEPNIFVTGGDLRQFTQYLGYQATFVADMVLSGIAVAATRET